MGFYRIIFGKKGEETAVKAIKSAGYRIVEKNYRCRHGEIDIIARDGDSIVFIEVKARSTDSFGAPQASVTASKQRKIASSAAFYLAEKGLTDVNARFDVVSVEGSGADQRVEIIRDAFEAIES